MDIKGNARFGASRLKRIESDLSSKRLAGYKGHSCLEIAHFPHLRPHRSARHNSLGFTCTSIPLGSPPEKSYFVSFCATYYTCTYGALMTVALTTISPQLIYDCMLPCMRISGRIPVSTSYLHFIISRCTTGPVTLIHDSNATCLVLSLEALKTSSARREENKITWVMPNPILPPGRSTVKMMVFFFYFSFWNDAFI